MEKPETTIISTLGAEMTKKLHDVMQGALKEGLEALNIATRTEIDPPHGYDAVIEWLRFDGKEDKVEHIAFRMNTVLLKQEGGKWKEIPSYCENQGFDIPASISPTDMPDELHDTMLQILLRFHSTSFRIQLHELK